MFYSSFSSCINQFFGCVGSCLGCFVKSKPIIAAVGKPCVSDDFWSTSTHDLDYSPLQSQKSLPSISISNQSLRQLNGTNNQSDFVNQGLLLWNQSRAQWVGAKRARSHGKFQEPMLCWSASYENVLSTSKRFSQPVPLSDMVDFLVEVWDQEGMYD